MKFLFLSALLAFAAGRPQDFPGESEVELIDPVSTNEDVPQESGDGPFVVVIRGRPSISDFFPFSGGSDSVDRNPIPGFGSAFGSSFGSVFNGNPFRGSGGLFPRLPSIFGAQPSDEAGEDKFDIDLDSILGSGLDNAEEDEEVEEDVNGACGPLCTIFNLMKGIQGGLHGIHQGIYGNGTKSIFDDEYDLNNSTYEEKVLEDGSIVRINRTVLADKDGFGNSIYIKSFISHNVNVNDDDDDDDESAEVVEADLDDAEIIDNINEQGVISDEDFESVDPSLNEVDEDPILSDEFSGVDGGLQE